MNGAVQQPESTPHSPHGSIGNSGISGYRVLVPLCLYQNTSFLYQSILVLNVSICKMKKKKSIYPEAMQSITYTLHTVYAV